MGWMILPLKRYADFRGRSRRKEFWMWVLFLVIAEIVLMILDGALGLGGRGVTGSTVHDANRIGAFAHASGGFLTGLFALAVLIPNLAVQVRRLHDLDRSGWWIVLPMILYILGAILFFAGAAGGGGAMEIIGGVLMFGGFIVAIVLLVWFCLPGTAGPNRFGADPLDPLGLADLEEVYN